MESTGVQIPVAVEVRSDGKFGQIFLREIIQRYDFYDFMFNAKPDQNMLAVMKQK